MVYSAVEEFLLATFDLTPGVNDFPFLYDWRRDERAAARQLADRSRSWLADWSSRSGNTIAQLVLVAHSMGRLVSRYLVEALGGGKDTKAVLTFGTPFYGSLNALVPHERLSERYPPAAVDLSPVLQSCTSVHQLVPTYRSPVVTSPRCSRRSASTEN